MKKLLVVGVIVLFLGLAIAPSINANVSNDKENKRTQEVLNDMENYDCVIYGKLGGFSCLIPRWVRYSPVSENSYIAIATRTLYGDSPIPRKFIKFGFDSEFIFGYVYKIDHVLESDIPASGTITTIGSEGALHWSGNFYGNIDLRHLSFAWQPYQIWKDYYFFSAIAGFSGIRIFLKGTCYLFGYADEVKVSSSTPPY